MSISALHKSDSAVFRAGAGPTCSSKERGIKIEKSFPTGSRPRRPAGRSVLHDAGWPARGGFLAAMADPRDETARRPLPGDPVPPLGFGAVEGLVGGLDDGVRLAHGLGPLGEIGRAHV